MPDFDIETTNTAIPVRILIPTFTHSGRLTTLESAFTFMMKAETEFKSPSPPGPIVQNNVDWSNIQAKLALLSVASQLWQNRVAGMYSDTTFTTTGEDFGSWQVPR